MDAAKPAMAFNDLKRNAKMFGHIDIGLHFPETGEGVRYDDILAVLKGFLAFGFAFGVGFCEPTDIELVETLPIYHEHIGFKMNSTCCRCQIPCQC